MTTAHELARFEDDGGPVHDEDSARRQRAYAAEGFALEGNVVECHRCHALVAVVGDGDLETHGPDEAPCPSSRLNVYVNEERFLGDRDDC